MLHQTAVVDVFCGIGGLSHGFIQENFKILAGVDVDESCKYAYEYNNNANYILEDICKLKSETVNKIFNDVKIKILVGCAPCQPFSSYNTGDRKKDGKWRLLYSFSELIRAVQPDIFSMENVPTLRKFEKGRILKDFISSLIEAGYQISDYDIHCPDYGIPQNRTRLVLFGSKYGKIDIIKPTHDADSYKTVADAIYDLPEIKAGEICRADPLHRSAKLSFTNLQRIRNSKPGGTWRDWPETLRAKCHCKESGASYPSVYGRMLWDKPSPTITTLCYGYGNGRFGHPEQDRAISLREAALLQTFPSDYKFVKPGGIYSMRTLGRQIGNAVPVILGRIIARSIKQHIETNMSSK